MKAISSFAFIYLHRDPVDMRRGINGLCDIVHCAQMGNLMGRNLFVFSGKRKDSLKILYFDKSGFALWQKRLEREKFKWPRKHGNEIVQISPEQLNWLLEGFDIFKMKSFTELNYERVS